MQLADSWRAIGESLVSDGERGRGAGRHPRRVRPRSWRALFSNKPRSLLVPAHNRRAQRSSVDFFVTHPLNRLYARTLLGAHRWLPRSRLLPELTLPPVDGPTLLDQLLPPASQIAFQIGTPGPYQKASMLAMAPDGTPLLLAKIALKASADEMVMTEARWLHELARLPRFEGKVPRLLKHGLTPNGRGYLAMSVAPTLATTSAFTSAHRDFLADLARVRQQVARFPDSPACRYLARCFEQLAPAMKPATAALLGSALAECAERLAGWHGPFVLAHGDFAPWNIRVHGAGIFVFDWEYAWEGSIPLRDVCHYCLAPAAVTGRNITAAQFESALDHARDFALAAHPGCDWQRPVIKALALGYLLHTVLCYSLSRGRVIEEHPVIRAYCRLIEERAQWID
ncbi:MAG: aminoglycoside phosphotransferase family protein [Pseudomonadota bacterium]